MKSVLTLFTVILVLSSACKKQETTPEFQKTFRFDIKNHEVVFGLKRVHFLTDSVYFHFATVADYNCDKWRINSGVQDEGHTLNMVLGNIYYDGTQCVYGNFPATASYRSPKLAEGNYKIIVQKSGTEYTGELVVTASEYRFNWAHDADCMLVQPKTFPRQ